MKNIFFILLSLIFNLCFAQTSNNQKLQSIKEYREKLVKSISRGDSIKETRCKIKIQEYLNLARRQLIRVDSITNVVKDLNKIGSENYYYIIFSDPVYFDWGDCNKEVIVEQGKDVTITHYTSPDDSNEDLIYCKFVIKKESKFSIKNDGLSTGQIFYREDFR